MTTISVTLYGRLRDYLPREQRGKTELPVGDAHTVAELLSALGIDESVMVAVNSEQEVAADHPLVAGDKVLVFAPAAGG